MSKLHEVINSLNDEMVSDEVKQQILAEADALEKTNKQLFRRAKKAEGYTFNKETEEWEKLTEEKKVEVIPEAKVASNEPDYAKLAFLEQRGLKHADDQKLVQEEAERLKMPLTDVLGMEHIQSKLKNASDQREAAAGMPTGGNVGTGQTRGDVDYWLSKPPKADGTFEAPSDPELHAKVIEARITKETQANKFSDELIG